MITISKTQILATKILPPQCAAGLIDRPRLLDLIAQVQAKQVTVIQAGPGFGKTSLAVAWAERLQKSGKAIAWLTLDADDDEPARFLFYVSHALRRASDGVGEAAIGLISDVALVPFNTIVSTWINDLADIDDDVYLFLDDYHRITDTEIRDSISYLLRYAPTQFHLVLTATGEHSLPLARLRAHNQLLEIDTAALRFDVEETRQFLEQENIGGLETSEVRLLHAKTEGWPAVLRIIAATLCQPGQDSTVAVIAEVQSILERQAGVGNVWSLETLRRWLIEAGKPDVSTLKQYVDMLPKHLTRRFISADQDAVVVSGRIPDVDASRLLPVVDALCKSLDKVRVENPGYSISVTGLAAIAARNSANMIEKLNRGLTFEFVFVAAFIGAAFRAFVVMLAAILPGIFPVVASGALLSVTRQGLQFASVVALIVSFGLGLSATIHFLNRLRLEDRQGQDPGVAVERATVLVGPALILTSVVLACGLAVTVFSDLPSLRLFGWLSAFAMITVLTADLRILRPMAMFLQRIDDRISEWSARRGQVHYVVGPIADQGRHPPKKPPTRPDRRIETGEIDKSCY